MLGRDSCLAGRSSLEMTGVCVPKNGWIGQGVVDFLEFSMPFRSLVKIFDMTYMLVIFVGVLYAFKSRAGRMVDMFDIIHELFDNSHMLLATYLFPGCHFCS